MQTKYQRHLTSISIIIYVSHVVLLTNTTTQLCLIY